MIPDYKLYHGAVLAEIVHELSGPVSIDELTESGRLSSYVLNGTVGIYIKHSTQRLRPWSFTFTTANLDEIDELCAKCETVYLAFVGHMMGIVCLSWSEFTTIMDPGASGQAWVRVDRPRGKRFSVFGARGALAAKKPNGVECLTRYLTSGAPLQPDEIKPQQTSTRSRFSFAWLTRDR